MRFLIILFIIINLFSYNFKEIKTAIKSNSHKIEQILNSNNNKDKVLLLQTAIYLNRLDIIKKAKKSDLFLKNKDGSNLLQAASFLAKPDIVKYLINYINPNETNKRRKNSLQMVISGIYQEYNFLVDDRFVEVKNKKIFKLYKQKLKKEILQTIKILKQNGAVSEYPNDYYTSTNILNALKNDRDKINPFIYQVFMNYFNPKQKMVAYVIDKKYNQAKELIKKYPQITKYPYFIDSKKHILWILGKLKEYRFTKWLLEHYPNIINKNIIGGFAKNPYNLYDKKYLKLFDRYSYPEANLTKVIKSIDDKNYKELDKLTYHRFFSISSGELYLDDFLYTPLIYAILQKDKKAVQILLKNGANISGWNKIHYGVLTGKIELNYPKWTKIYKINEKGTLNGFTPITLAIIYNPKYIEKFLPYITKIDENTFYFAIKNNLEYKFLPFVKDTDTKELVLLAQKREFDIIKKLYQKGAIDKYDLYMLDEKIKNTKYYKEYLKEFEDIYVLKKCKESELFIVYPRIDNKQVLKCLKAGYKFGDGTLVALIEDGNPEVMKYLVKYKNHKLRDKYYPIFFITKKEFLDKFTTPKSKSQRIVAECTITLDKNICKKAIKKAITLKNYNFAANIAIKTNQPYLVKDYVHKLFNMFKMCYYLETDPKKAKQFGKKIKAKCPYKIENLKADIK